MYLVLRYCARACYRLPNDHITVGHQVRAAAQKTSRCSSWMETGAGIGSGAAVGLLEEGAGMCAVMFDRVFLRLL